MSFPSHSTSKIIYSKDDFRDILKAMIQQDGIDPLEIVETGKVIYAQPSMKTFKIKKIPKEGGRDKSRRHQQSNSPNKWERAKLLGSAESTTELHKAPVPYKISDGTEDYKVKLKKEIKSNLNKITKDKFDKLSPNFITLDIRNKSDLDLIVNGIFDMALRQPFLCDVYAKLCSYISSRENEFVDKIENTIIKEVDGFWCVFSETEKIGPYSSEEKATVESLKKIGFRFILLGKIRKEFSGKTTTEPTTIDITTKKIMLSNIKLIGEIYLNNLINETPVDICLKVLLKNIETPPPEYIECAVDLLRSVGKRLDTPERSTYMEAYFTRFNYLIKNKGLVPMRIRFMCEQLVVDRKNNWILRKEVQRTKTKEAVKRKR